MSFLKKEVVTAVGDERWKSCMDLSKLRSLYLTPPPSSSSSSSSSEASNNTNQQYIVVDSNKSYPPVLRLPPAERRRILVTGGAGFVGSHLVDRLMLMGHQVVALDNLFTGGKHNIAHWLGHPNFEFIRHDVVGKQSYS